MFFGNPNLSLTLRDNIESAERRRPVRRGDDHHSSHAIVPLA